jgi:F0F1-type ATP synthase delta subunit
MDIASQYARALHELVEKEPAKGKEYLRNLREVLMQRGHGKLLPRIYGAYERLQLRSERSKRFSTATKEQERTRKLVELYRHLVNTH